MSQWAWILVMVSALGLPVNKVWAERSVVFGPSVADFPNPERNFFCELGIEDPKSL